MQKPESFTTDQQEITIDIQQKYLMWQSWVNGLILLKKITNQQLQKPRSLYRLIKTS